MQVREALLDLEGVCDVVNEVGGQSKSGGQWVRTSKASTEASTACEQECCLVVRSNLDYQGY